jgi:hypothetical protein
VTDAADAAELEVSAQEQRAVRRPSGRAPCTCQVIECAGKYVTECEIADARGIERPAGCTRRGLDGMPRAADNGTGAGCG